MLPDVVDDVIVNTARRIGVQYCEQVFFRAAVDAGFTNPHDVARHRHGQWLKQGYQALPPYVKDFCLRACNGEVQPIFHHSV